MYLGSCRVLRVRELDALRQTVSRRSGVGAGVLGREQALGSPDDLAAPPSTTYPRAAALLAAVFDDRVITVAGIRYRHRERPARGPGRYWRAERSGELVGWAVGGLDAFASCRTAAFAGIAVHPAHRGEGIGSALWDVPLGAPRRDRSPSHRRPQPSRRRHEGVRRQTRIQPRGDGDELGRRSADGRVHLRRHRRESRSVPLSALRGRSRARLRGRPRERPGRAGPVRLLRA